MADKKNWLQLLAYVTGSINQELLLRNEYLAAENHILKSQIKGRLRLSDGQRTTLAGIAKRLGRKALQEVACIAKPDTILAWYRKFVAQKFDGSKKSRLAGRPRVDAANKAQPGASSFGRTWMCWQARTSLRWKCSRGRGLATYYVLFFIHLGNRRVSIAGITDHPDAMAYGDGADGSKRDSG